jgi:hypothetical protein
MCKRAWFAMQLILEKEAIIYCKNGILQEIEFDFMIIRKLQTGKYKVQLNKNSIRKMPKAITFGFNVLDGISTVIITFK